MSNHTFASATTSATALNMLTLAGYATIDNARADNVAFVCVECGSTMTVTPTPESSREQQQATIAEFFAVACCGDENMFLV